MSPSRFRALVIACCSARKSRPATLVPRTGEGGDFVDVVSDWLGRLDAAEPVAAAGSLYLGRSFKLVSASARRHGHRLAIISAGLGVVEAERQVPSYEVTPESGPGALVRTVPQWSARSWWRAVSAGPFASDLPGLVASHPLTLIALTAPYAKLIGDDLERIESFASRLRIFGRGLKRHLPSTLSESIMPYDDRLELVGHRGTMGDSAARALVDFVDHVGSIGSCEVDADRVRSRLAGVERPVRNSRSRVDDSRISSRVESWRRSEPGISRSTLLSRLRHDAGVACSEDRLRRVLEAL